MSIKMLLRTASLSSRPPGCKLQSSQESGHFTGVNLSLVDICPYRKTQRNTFDDI